MPLPLGRTPAGRAAAPPPRNSALQLRARGGLAEAGPVDHGAAAAERAGLVDHRGHGRGRGGHDDGVRRRGQVGQRGGRTGSRATSSRPGLTPQTVPGVTEPAQVEERLAGVRALAVVRAYDRDRLRVEQPLH